MSSTTDTAKSNNTSLLSRIFRRGSKLPAKDAASTTSQDPLVHGQPMKSTSNEEHDLVSELMAKANTMGEGEFKAYLKQHKEEVEAMYRKQGGGIASGDWVSRDWATDAGYPPAEAPEHQTLFEEALQISQHLHHKRMHRCFEQQSRRIKHASFKHQLHPKPPTLDSTSWKNWKTARLCDVFVHHSLE
ncbi:hypothetical protein G647_08555 [Cladophialophora carrionii CBS 160.54]|uniref:Uncharacterized protein n=1 Tax=Cladophialophora carrionii CBS 160.54 TaxID=1279043 RepID=V9D2K7_9EURO|nr:uncharacterized protein G647_08555 [Cladophialophora carrionii CBS 160.54]ETI20518.1 hypothetical protein G647_08555 [Cladophialophora carrionii CBS 160.54]